MSSAAPIKNNTEKVAKNPTNSPRTRSITKPSAENKLCLQPFAGACLDIIQNPEQILAPRSCHFSCSIYSLRFICVTFASQTRIPAIRHHAGGMTSRASSPSRPSLASLSIYLFPSAQMETKYSSKKQMSCSRKRTAFYLK